MGELAVPAQLEAQVVGQVSGPNQDTLGYILRRNKENITVKSSYVSITQNLLYPQSKEYPKSGRIHGKCILGKYYLNTDQKNVSGFLFVIEIDIQICADLMKIGKM